jgi:hypothetical protein
MPIIKRTDCVPLPMVVCPVHCVENSEHSSPPDSPASQQLQQVCTILIFPSLQLISLPTQHLPKQPYILYLIPVTKDPVPLNTSSPQNDTTPKLTQTPDHTTPSHTAHISNPFPTIKTLYTYTLIAFTPHSSALHNTTRYTYLLLQDRQP